MNGSVVGGILVLSGFIFGIFISGGMKAANRLTRTGHYAPMPGGHRKINHTVVPLGGNRPPADHDGCTF
jgi:hypothetical protein